jgi:hypothetical protein
MGISLDLQNNELELAQLKLETIKESLNQDLFESPTLSEVKFT